MSHDDPSLPFAHYVLIYLGYGFIFWLGFLHEVWDKFSGVPTNPAPKGYAPLFTGLESFWTRRMYRRIREVFQRPVAGCPGAWIELAERYSPDYGESFVHTGKTLKCLNLGSYNYLGFSSTSGPCLENSIASIRKYGISTCSPHVDSGSTALHHSLEREMAEFLGMEDCIIFGMGYATNALTLPVIVGKGDLIISDSLNHASIVVGVRGSGAKCRVFKHNDVEHLESVIRECIIQGQPRTRRPWRKILIVVEGIYSMEGEVCRLPDIVRLKNKYKCYLWVDEAHSIGALGSTGRGVCEYWNIPTSEIDLLMGTFTKSFAGVGGYICGKRDIIQHLRDHSYASLYSTTMTTGCAEQTLTALHIIEGKDGTNVGKQKLKQLRDNANYFRSGLLERGFQVIGDEDSPVIPLMLFHPAKISVFAQECLRRRLAVVVVGFPATSPIASRARFCISAGHTREDLDWALREIDDVGEGIFLKYNRK